MVRTTLKECIDLFNSNEIQKERAIRGMEHLGEWRTAAKFWAKMGDKGNEGACKLIADAVELGDRYRAEVKQLNEWVDYTVEQGLLTKDKAVNVVFGTMETIYRKHYKS
jgi:hypothetical protein